jgi:hypothetical protein
MPRTFVGVVGTEAGRMTIAAVVAAATIFLVMGGKGFCGSGIP